MTKSRAVSEYFKGESSASQAASGEVCLIMDECDGMSSSDRGGIQALTDIILKSDIPIICICNDREKQQIRTLAKYCVDLKFSRPLRLTR